MIQPTTSSSVITQRLLGELAHVPHQLFSRLRDKLPEAVPLHTGTPGRPPLVYSVDDVAALVAAQTSHLSDLACRLRVALGATSPLRIVQVEDKHVLVYDHEPLEELDEATRQALLDQIHVDRDTASQRRTRRPIAQEQQP
ncbi:hypothetical protein [Pseudomonas putida]|uniref:hypothetical protein n=1 Tax=Pseudomonas putida TaxID=303 RepID=UPI0039068520